LNRVCCGDVASGILHIRGAKPTRAKNAVSKAPENSSGEINMTDNRVRAGERNEDQFTAMLESQTSTLPSSLFLGAAAASIVGSVALQLTGRKHEALFVGQWVAPFLLLGIYNKLVKQHGSDAEAASNK
jgi:hypothetical protein